MTGIELLKELSLLGYENLQQEVFLSTNPDYNGFEKLSTVGVTSFYDKSKGIVLHGPNED